MMTTTRMSGTGAFTHRTGKAKRKKRVESRNER